MQKNTIKETNKEKTTQESKGWKVVFKELIYFLALYSIAFSMYYYLYSKQREIDNYMGITKSLVVENIFNKKSGWLLEYTYEIKGKIYKETSVSESGLDIDKNKTYRIEYSTIDPENSRIIINGVTYNDGVD